MSHLHHLELTVTEGPAVLERVVGTVRSRGCEIVGMHFEAGNRHRAGHIVLTMSATGRQVELATGRLSRLLDVSELRCDGPSGRALGPSADAPPELARR
jgi:acetolactate synthase regulatory subunit